MQYLVKISHPRQCCVFVSFASLDIKDPFNWSPFVRNKEPEMAMTETDRNMCSQV